MAAAGLAAIALSPVLGFELRLSKPTYYLVMIAAVTWAVLRHTAVAAACTAARPRRARSRRA
uniref:hypothetical protein n=1 Tax=Nonomuraea pusilla TaxID=46177 RepID=UPI0006E45400|nr:hypothetical protein [Nonomuraea pusilla]